MDRRRFLKLASASFPLSLSACGYFRIDPMNVFIRSEVIDTPEKEKEVISRARLEKTDDGRITVLYVKGTPYERGFQQGYLLRDQIQDNFGHLYKQALSKFQLAELFDEAYERQRAFLPQEYVDEMHGLAHGSKMPLHIIHAMHALPEIGEWGGKKKIKKIVQGMMDGSIGETCSNFCAFNKATADGNFYTVRILDWGLHRISKLHEFPLITVNVPESGFASANISWMGFLGAISGMNEQGITLGEMGYGDPEGESMSGKPMIFLLRDVLRYAKNLKDVRKLIQDAPGTNSFIYLMSDGKSKEAELYVRDRKRFLVYKPGVEIKDEKNTLPPIENVLYGGHYHDRMTELLNKYHGQLTPQIIMKELIPGMAMPSNFQNVIYDPVQLQFWVANAKSPAEPAAFEPYSFYDFKKGLGEFRGAQAQLVKS